MNWYKRLRADIDGISKVTNRLVLQRYALLAAMKLIATGSLDKQRLWCAKNIGGSVDWSNMSYGQLCFHIATQAIAESEA